MSVTLIKQGEIGSTLAASGGFGLVLCSWLSQVLAETCRSSPRSVLLHATPVSLCHASLRHLWGKHTPLLPCFTEGSLSEQTQPLQISPPYLILATGEQGWCGWRGAPCLTSHVLQRNGAVIEL